MDQPNIAPLARRLAEENNVDWRRLRGSGDEGRVVERDVLEYLARVMAGDEAIDPTPEPVPEGMQAWPDADVRAGRAEAERDEVEPTSTIDDDIFLFDDGSSDGDGDREGAAEPDDDGLLWSDAGSLGGEVDLDARAAAPAVEVEMDDLEEDLLVEGDDEPEPRDDAPSDESDGVGSVALGAPSGDRASDPGLPDLFGPGPSQPTDGDEPPALFAEDDDEGYGAPSAWASGPELGDETDDEPTWGANAEMGAVPSIDEPTAARDGVLSDRLPSDDADAADEPADVDDGVDDDVDDDVPADLAVSLDDAHVRSDEPDDVGLDVGLADGASAPPVAVPSPHAGQATIGRDVPLLRHRHVWRRQVDLTALVAAQADLAVDLGRDDPVPIGAFLLRAGQKALAARGGVVALASIDAGDVRRARVSEASDFASTVAELERTMAAGASDDGTVDLVVADLSELGIDDAVLQLDAPVLMLGRILIDTLSGGRRAYLTMSGEGADGSDAAQLLARVAELLESPVRIVV
ncbi:MAG: hypothetical protein EA416_14670 [Trueperaceae bacterium]|nr:MAG: hypothetical protein EA416_14670 [Trueperaceae bacterium]